ncbi:hypothetical protein [Aeribacillus composti]|jgi:hypothetical protein|nr:hypothetical protein [Aeribacillus composti]
MALYRQNEFQSKWGCIAAIIENPWNVRLFVIPISPMLITMSMTLH